MILHVINSSSRGNGYVIETKNSALVLECGVSFDSMLKTIDYRIEKIIGGVVSHSHGDHSKYIKEYLHRGVKLLNNIYPHHNSIEAKHRELIKIGEFKILPLLMKHDVECFGYVIYHEEFGSLLFVTDTSEIPYKLQVNHLLIESNYSTEILDNKQLDGKIHGFLAKRIEQSHLSFENCSKWVMENKRILENVVLLHLSESNSDITMFQSRMQSITGVPVTVATSNSKIMIGI